MYEQMVNYVSRNSLISSFQSGFRPGHSTATAIARVSDDIRLIMESNQPTILVLLDFSKAFDSLCHGLFILKLHQRYRQWHLSLLIFLLGIKKLHVGTMFVL
jgi:Reverse transcriptase (RNA-dependent DNA polymerase)